MSPSDSTNLTHDGGPATTDTYFASPELSQRADLLRHLTENSNLIPLVRGAEGMGKSTFIQHLLDLAPENWIPVEINADVMLQPDALLADLADLFDQDDSSDRLMDDLIRHFDSLRQDGFLPVIIVDDAHLLPEASIITLLRLHERGNNDTPLAQILLFAEPEIDELLKTPQLRVMNLRSVQLLDMPEFTLDQTELYLEHLLAAAVSSAAVTRLTASQIEHIHYETGGSPGLIKEQAENIINSANKNASSINLRDYFSTKSVIGGGLASIVVMFLLIYQNEINSIFSGEDDPSATTQEERALKGDSVSLPIPEFVAGVESEQELAEEGAINQVVPSDMEVVEGEKADLGSVPDKGVMQPEEQVPQQEASQLKKGQGFVEDPPMRSEGKGVALPADEHRPKQPDSPPIQSTEKEEVKKVTVKASNTAATEPPPKTEGPQQVEQQGLETANKEPKAKAKKEKKSEVPAENKGEVITSVRPVVKAAVSTTTKPQKTVESKPAPLVKKVMPAPVEDRSTVLVQKEAPSINATEGQQGLTKKKTTTTPKNPSVVSPKVGPSGFLREEWLLKQSPSGYTIQLVGFQDEKGIAEFVRRHSVSGHIAYYRTTRKGKPWFPVLYGAYSTRSRAVEARNNLPESLIKSGAWLRTLSSVQKDIKAR